MKATHPLPSHRQLIWASLTGALALALATAVSSAASPTNTATGGSALLSITTGIRNTADGYFALKADNTGSVNVAIGSYALQLNTSGAENTALGDSVLASNLTGSKNTGFGNNALKNNNSGTGNIGLGNSAGSLLTTGNYNIDIGAPGVAGEANTIRLGTAIHTDTYLNGTLHSPGLLLQGSGTGTTNGLQGPVLVRRVVSFGTDDETSPSVVAISDGLSLQRDGTDAGFVLVTTNSYSASGNHESGSAMGVSSAGANVNSVGVVPKLTADGTSFPVFTNAQDVTFFTISFGDPFGTTGQTIVQLQRESGDYYWMGIITSTTNQ